MTSKEKLTVTELYALVYNFITYNPLPDHINKIVIEGLIEPLEEALEDDDPW